MKWLFVSLCLLGFLGTPSHSQEIFGAVMSGDLSKTRILLEEHPEWVNAKSWGGWTPLHRASHSGHGDIVALLISKGGRLDAETDLGMTPLYVAIMGQQPEVVRHLISEGANVFAARSDGETLLHIAAAMGRGDVAAWLISKGLNVDSTKRYGVTPLHLASVFGHSATVETLLSHGADIDRPDDMDCTALHLATAAGETETAALLEERGASDAPEPYAGITGAYLGQEEPGSTPRPFAPGILLNTQRPHGGIAFSPDGKEVYWVAALDFGQFQRIWTMRQVNGQWSRPKAVSFSDPYTYGGPAISPDGERFYFDVRRPTDQDGRKQDHDIWFRERDALGWREAIKPGPPLNSDKSALGPSVSRNGTIYFYSFDIEDGFGSMDIYRSRPTREGYSEPENLGDSINTEFAETLPHIAPDESYLLFSSMRPDGYGDFDLYVSYRNEDGTWTRAMNMGRAVNTPSRESTSSVSPDGKYLFFMSRRNGVGEFFWMDAKIIEERKPEEARKQSQRATRAPARR